MIDILREYALSDCDKHGVPLDWDLCRRCGGQGRDPCGFGSPDPWVCRTCNGHGNLKAAVLAARIEATGHTAHRARRAVAGEIDVRCEGCAHPMSEGTWDPEGWGDAEPQWTPGDPNHKSADEAYMNAVKRWLREGSPDPGWAWVHYSPCDEACRHGGPGRWRWPTHKHPNAGVGDTSRWWVVPLIEDNPTAGREVEASWRPVDVRPPGERNDLRLEQLAVLCLRCFAGS